MPDLGPRWLSFLDILFSLLFVGPFTVLYWRGTFVSIFNFFISEYPASQRWLPSLILYIIGLNMKILVDLIKHSLRERLENRGGATHSLVKITIIYLDCLFSVVMWVGGFYILYSVFPAETFLQLSSTFLLSSLVLLVSRGFCSTAGSPLTIIRDTDQNVFQPSSYQAVGSVVLDTVISFSLLHSLVISAWWGCWELENNFILQDCEIVVKDLQAWDSVILALLCCGLVYSLEQRVQQHWESGGRARHLVFYFMAFLSFLASLNYWRGLWSLMDFYFFPGMDPSLNLVLSHVVGFLWSLTAGTGLTLTQSSARDPPAPEFNKCRYWRREEAENSETPLPTENTPIIARQP